MFFFIGGLKDFSIRHGFTKILWMHQIENIFESMMLITCMRGVLFLLIFLQTNSNKKNKQQHSFLGKCWIIAHLQLIQPWFIMLLCCQNIFSIPQDLILHFFVVDTRMLISFMSACQYILPWVLPTILTQHAAPLTTGWHTAHMLEYSSWIPRDQINHTHSLYKWGWTVMYVVGNWHMNEITPKGHAIRW